jgi:hypothetical protein
VNKKELYQLFKKFQQGKLNSDQESKFNNDLSGEPVFKSQFEEYTFFKDLLAQNDLSEVKDILNNLDYGVPKSSSSFKKYFLLGIAIVIGGVIAYMLFLNISKSARQEKEIKSTEVEKKDREQSTVIDSTVQEYEPIGGVKESRKKVLAPQSLNTDTTLITVENSIPIHTDQNNESQESNVSNPKTKINKVEEKCDVSNWVVNEKTTKSCENEMNGSFTIGVSNIDKPCVIIFDGLVYHKSGYVFKFLSSNDYKVVIKDSRGCSLEKIITIKSKECDLIELDILIDPKFGVYWNYPLKDNETDVVIIRNKGGQVVFKKEVTSEDSWEGVDEKGNQLSGILFYEFESRKDLIGSITIP